MEPLEFCTMYSNRFKHLFEQADV
jgi:methionyl-tRNA synthetase